MAVAHKLADLPDEFWANTILWRLAEAVGVVRPGDEALLVDADTLLEEVEERLWVYADLRGS